MFVQSEAGKRSVVEVDEKRTLRRKSMGFNPKNSVFLKHKLARSVLDRSRSTSSYLSRM